MKPRYLYFFAVCLLWYATATGSIRVLDQAQEASDTGLALTPGLTRWQEFTPAYDNAAQVDLRFYRSDGGGTLDIALTDSLGGNTLWSSTISETAIPAGFNWIEIAVDPVVSLVAGNIYRIELQSQWDGGVLNWMGKKTSAYDAGVTDRVSFWEDFDYAFRTKAIPEPATVVLLAVSGFLLKQRICVKKQKNAGVK